MVFFGAREDNGSWVDPYALHAADGSLAWKQRVTEVSSIGGLLVLHNLIYIETGASTDSTDYIIRALNVRDGSLRWFYRYPTDFSHDSQGLSDIGNGMLDVTTSTHLFAYDAANGRLSWSYTFSPNKYDGYAPLYVGNGMLSTTSIHDGTDIHLIDTLKAATGKLVQQQSITISGYVFSLTLTP